MRRAGWLASWLRQDEKGSERDDRGRRCRRRTDRFLLNGPPLLEDIIYPARGHMKWINGSKLGGKHLSRVYTRTYARVCIVVCATLRSCARADRFSLRNIAMSNSIYGKQMKFILYMIFI